ncbi:MAG: DUF434 domain-containing protein [Candidatus Hodarchaeota archaeon]
MTEKNYREPLVKQAFQDVIYLIERGYHKNSSINFVTSRYLLNTLEKNIVFRTAAPLHLRKEFMKKKIPNLKEREIAIDGFNILITVEKILQGSNLLFKALDTFLRDVSAVYGKYTLDKLTTKTMNLIITSLEKLEIKRAVFLLDSAVSRSGELAAKFRRLKPENFDWEARTSRYPDIEVLEYGIVLSHDSEVAKKAKKIFDLPLWILNHQSSSVIYTDTYKWLSMDFLEIL